jgi:hypothetical protein
VHDYEQWAHAVDTGKITPKPGGPTAWDYQLTITAIEERKAKYASLTRTLAAGRAS